MHKRFSRIEKSGKYIMHDLQINGTAGKRKLLFLALAGSVFSLLERSQIQPQSGTHGIDSFSF